MFKNVLKTVRSLFLVSLLVLSVLAILTLGPVPTYTTPVDVSTYYEGSTTVVNDTALNTTSNLDANDEVYYAVDSAPVPPVIQSETLTYNGTVSGTGWSNVSGIDADDTSYASATAKNRKYWVAMDDHTISGTISSVIIKIDCWANVTTAAPEFILGFSVSGNTTDLATYDIDCTTSEATYSWDITSYITNWAQIDNLLLSVKANDPGGPEVDVWYVDYHRVEVEATTTLYEVNVEHTSEQVVEPIGDITQIFLEDNFKFNTTVTAYLEWFNWTANAWANVNSGPVGTTEVTWNKTWASGFSDVINSTGYMKVKIYTSNESSVHRLLEDHLYWNVTYLVPDTNPPTWLNAGTNNTAPGQPTLFHVKWTDSYELDGFVFGTNNTGTWANDTWTSMSGTTDWSNVTKTLTSSPGVLVQWRVWANDTANNWNDTGTLSLTTLYPPHAEFTYSPLTPYTGENVTFNASASYDPDGTIISHAWNFGDNTNATGATTSHSYADNGIYTVTLNVTDNDGLSDIFSANVTVLNRSPVANFTESAETVDTGEIVYFNATQSSDPDGTIVTYFWSFGDGTNATGVTVNHSYVDNGTYTVILIVTDDDGATDNATAIKTVLNRSPVANFTESAESVYVNETISFNASSSYDSDGFIVSYFWDFGDGTNATGVTTGHFYTALGTYTVTLTVTDNDGATVSANATKFVVANLLPVAVFTENATVILTGEMISFNASSSYDPDGTIVSYFWNFGDGTNGTDVVVDHLYAENGIYTVTLTVTDNGDATGSVNATKTVLNRLPVASFVENATIVLTGEVILFNASSSSDPDGSIVSYFWDFGDSINATGITSSHSYVDDGTYTVTLTVTDDDGGTGSANATKIVLNRSPVASFTENATVVLTNEAISFDASASYDPDGMIVNYFWDFGDGSNATGITTTHYYADDGTYTVTLTVADDDGASDSANATKTVLNRSPVASFVENATIVLTGEVILFNASSSSDPDGTIVSYFWTFGDGANATGVTSSYFYADDGIYTVTLTITDDDGATDSANATKTVLNRSPVAVFTESAETVDTGEIISFNASLSYDLDGTVVNYFWDFGDGSNATGITTTHYYADDGTYTVTLTVADDDGASDSANATKTVLNRSPVASFVENATIVLTGEVILFNASSSSDPDGTIVSYFWTFGDGTNGTDVTTSHSYADDGTYTVTLTVTDDDGAADSVNATKTVLNRSPVASFTENATMVLTNEAISFNASSSYDLDGTITSYFWDFGDGTNGTGVIVDHSYADNGTYTVTLIVTDDDGATDNTTAIKTVLNKSPVANFTESAEIVYTGEFITFNASASYDSDGIIVNYFWDFGDEINATGLITTHSYAENGTYTVTLTVIDDDGASGSVNATKTVLNRSPVAVFTESAETVYTGETIVFNASASFDLDGTIISYFWDFGDGANASGIAISHSYTDDGNYTVTLTITDDDGATDSANTIKTILNRLPVASFTESAGTVYTSEMISFNASLSSDPDGTISSYFWSFGDGTNATGVTVGHSYVDDGTYTVTLTVTDDDGAIASANATKTVLNRSPIANFTESAETVYIGEPITFNATDSYDPDGTIASYFWDFGDGTNATGVIVGHSYANNGTYTVTLTVTDDDGATDSVNATKTILLNESPVALFTESAETVYTNETIYFNASNSYDPDGTIVSYEWDFGDGTNATGVTSNHTYIDDGIYIVTLTVTDDRGALGTVNATKTVLNRFPVASFTENATTVLTGEVIRFNASSSSDPDGYIVTYFWDFGDGTNATGVTIDHSYADDGNYTVTLTVTDDDGATDSTTATKYVLNRPPVANFIESAETVYTSEVINFNASTSYDPDGTIISYFWDFGDGVNASGVIVIHAYADNGTYTVTLTVTDDDGATDSTNATKTVLNRHPVASFVENVTTVLTGEVISFNASASYDPDGSVFSYFWNFGDGTNATGVTPTHSYVDDGIYTVILTVTDDDSATDSTNATKTVLNRSPVASFTENVTTVLTGETISFNASASSDPDGSIVSYLWDFGDGTNATGVTTTHSYADNGTYTVTLTVIDDDGASGSVNATKTVLNRSPVASFTENATTVLTGETISFNASSSYDPDGSIDNYFWNFGDGTNGTGVTIDHSYADNGIYTVTLTVTDDDGATDNATAIKTVLNRPPTASFTESAETVYTGETISFNASISSDTDGTIVSYFWTFGDGTNATGVTVAHSYTNEGNYTVTLTITDDDGATDSVNATKTVLNRSPVAIFTESAETVYTGEVISFNASDSYDPDGTIINYFWDFGDGANATSVTESHSYTTSGNYTVTLTVTDNDGATNSANATKIVLNRFPVASFTENTTIVLTGEFISFNASASYDPDGSVVSYFWTFGDGTNATGVTTNHSYTDDGVYTVALTVTDGLGATSLANATKTVLNRFPVASFTENATIVLTGEFISFNASASSDLDGTIVSYFWTFGDGDSATGVTTTHSYADNGTYTVTLTVIDDDGASNSTSAVKYVLNRPPVAVFTENATVVLTGEAVNFNASASYDPDGSVVSYFWIFGDGTNATGVITTHSYVQNGTYTVTLTITDDDGATGSTNATKTVLENEPPVALFTENATVVLTGEVILFNASASHDPDGFIVSYFWAFGDGINATGTIVTHAYTDNGTYTVTLTVTDDDGVTDSTNATKIVLNRSPVASFTESAETVYTDETILFNASSSYDLDGSVVSYFWTFGDGTNTTGVTTSYSYAGNGTYTVTLTVTDGDGATGVANATKTILNRFPVAFFTESAESVYINETISFNASLSYDPDGSIVSYLWNFGDSTNATGVTTSHFYTALGNYTVTLTVTDDDGATGSANATKFIVANLPPVALFTENATTVLTGEVILFNASASYDQDGSIASYFWDFGDGINSTGVTTSHSYADDGVYTVALTVTDDLGATGSTSATKTVLNRPPVAVFTESAETVLTGETISFNASTSSDPDGTIASYFWDFGDDANAAGVTATHSYADNGTYTVTLTVIDDDGASNSTSAVKYVLNRPPIAVFTENATIMLTGEVIHFDASSSFDPDGVIVSYSWTFGDGANGTGVTVDHSYSDNGTYTVTLTVTDDDNAANTANSTKTVLNHPPVAAFIENATTVLTGEVISFNASLSYDLDGSVISYSWNFGDGINATGVTVSHSYVDDGVYTVTLIVTDDDGATASANATKTVLNRFPVASFVENATIVFTSEVIHFDASGSSDSDGSITTYYWDFGDSTNVSGVTVDHSYSDDGTYTVTLTVTDDDGATNSVNATKIVLNRPPVALFTENATVVLTGEVILFNASASYDLDGTVVSYFWTFGDGTNVTGVITTYSYAQNGTYTVTLTITDDDGATASTNATKTVLENEPPVALFTENATVVLTGEVISFNASLSYDPDGSIMSYLWDFGDSINATGVTVSHSYVDNGTYTVTLTVTDDDGATDSTNATKTVLNRFPVVSFTENATTVLTNEAISFNASASYDLDGSIVSYLWTFGDGTNATGMTTTHSYVDNGIYTVVLIVTDDDGAADTANSTKTVLNRPPIASFTESAETVDTGEIITFNASASYDPDGSIMSYLWDFGDGTNTTSVTTTHSYADNGTYTVTLTVTDDDGATALTNTTKTVLNRLPVALFTESAESVYINETISFNASLSYDPDGSIVSYFWDFGDGINATGVITSHSYNALGNYTVTLTVTDDDGATGSTNSTKFVVANLPPIALFTENAITVLTGEVISLNASISYDPDGSIVGYFWTFGDGTNATGVTVSHPYADDGVYTIALTVTDNMGATDSASATKTVLNRSPVALFAENATTVLTDEVISFDASSSFDPDGSIVSYFWAFGDGDIATGVITTHSYAEDGTYTVILTVIDDDGASSSTNATKYVLNRSPIAVFAENATTVLTDEVISFDASSSFDPDGVIVSYFWTFGDGANGTGVTVNHSYVDNGIYTVILTVTDDDGASDSANATKTVLNRSPVALFAENATTVLTDEVILFNASLSYDLDGSIVSYSWDFGDGVNATGVTTSHSYADDGTYIVTLTVTDDDGATGSANATKTVLNRSPVVSFTENATTVLTGEVISFDASSSFDPDGVIVSYFWTFGDGANGTGVTVNHSYVDNGIYTVILTVTDDDGASDSANATKTVLNRSPVALFAENATTVLTDEVILFNASLSYDLDGSIVSYSWTFGDGVNATGVTTSHSYADDGIYTVNLTVEDDDGAKNSTSVTKTVLNRPPVADANGPYSGHEGSPITFDASGSTDVDGTIVLYEWDWNNDGIYDNSTISILINYTWSDDFTGTVKLKVTDDDGLIDTATVSVTVGNVAPTVEVGLNQTADEGISVSFSGNFTDSSWLDTHNYFWDFGDGSNATGTLTPTHVYGDSGVYTVTLNVTDDDSGVGTDTAIVTIFNVVPTFEAGPNQIVNEGDPVNVAGNFSDLGWGDVHTATIDWGDGTQLENATITIINPGGPGTLKTGTVEGFHVYADNGVFTVTLNFTDDDGGFVVDSLIVTVYNVAPNVEAGFDQTVNLGQTVLFTGNVTDPGSNDTHTIFWDFGDGTNTTGMLMPTHVYTEVGVYIAILNVTDDDGEFGVDTLTINVSEAEFYDVAVIDVTLSASDAYWTWTVEINVTVLNGGTGTVSFNVTAYFSDSFSWYEIETQTATNLLASENTTLSFNWNLAGLAENMNYIVKANATLVYGVDSNLNNNEKVDGQLFVRLWGDVNGDGVINILDLKLVKLAYSGYIDEPMADLDGNGVVNILDLKKMRLIASGSL